MFAISFLALGILGTTVFTAQQGNSAQPSKLAVLWTSGDPHVAEKMLLMYTHAAQKNTWFDEVVLIVWGPSSKLLAETEKFQKKIKQMQKDGIKVEACVVCADMYGVSDQLRGMGIDVKGMGKPLSGYLKSDWKVLSL
ncbi:DsrE family protein [bacterium]|nr:DsrE family protein [bacterium]